MLTSKDLARILGVSQSTVSRALNNSPLISNKTKDSIKNKASEYGFVLNSQARSLKINKTGIVGILFPVFFESLSKNLMFTYIYDTLQKELIKTNYDVMVVYDCGDQNRISVLERIVKSQKVDGFVNLRPSLSEAEIELLNTYSCPYVSLFTASQDNPTLNQYRLDEFETGKIAGRYFGTTRDYLSTYLSLPLTNDNSKTRLKGYDEGLHEKGVQLQKFIICSLSMNSAYSAVMQNAQWYTDNKTATYVFNDMLAIGVIKALQDLHVSIPSQAQIIGTDDIPMATWIPPYLSTLRTPIDEIVKQGCASLYDMLEGKENSAENKFYSPVLIHRDTTLTTQSTFPLHDRTYESSNQ